MRGCGTSAGSRYACGRPRRGAVAAVLPHWSHDDGRLPGGRLTLQLPPPANGHGRGALCERRNGTASAQWAPRLPGQPASRLHLQALVRAAFDHFDPDRRGLWVRHADTHAQSNSYRSRAHPGRMSAHLRRPPRRKVCAVEPEFRSRRTEVSAKNPGRFGPKARRFPLLRAELSPQSSGREGGETTRWRGGRSPTEKVRGESPAAATERSDRKSGTDHYRTPDHLVGRCARSFATGWSRVGYGTRGVQVSEHAGTACARSKSKTAGRPAVARG